MGPYCGFVLQRLGADVVKVEPLEGEPYRRPSAKKRIPRMQFGMFNAGKRGLAIDLKAPEGRALFMELAKTVDVVLQNYGPGTFDRLVDVDELMAANPRLIVASGTGYGSGGPYSELKGMDMTIQAMSGVMSTTGFADGPPVRTGPAVVDILGGVHLAAAILGALLQRAVTGLGQRVEVSLYDSVFPSLASNIAGFIDSDGEMPERTGNRHGGLGVAPYNVYPTSNGAVAILCLHDRHFRALCQAMGQPELADDDRFETNIARIAELDRLDRLDRLDQIVGGWTKALTTEEVVRTLALADVPGAPVLSLKEVLADPHVLDRGLIEHHRRDGHEWWTLSSPLRLTGSPQPSGDAPPRLGEHSSEVVRGWLGLSETEVESLAAAGVIKDGSDDVSNETNGAGPGPVAIADGAEG